ncbi:hypothetical protein NC652_007752 [Populus alba x Populus x berolinensis]|nr:hypothetical protein NC652_007752 [Populus alba x Populus x berolinensis]
MAMIFNIFPSASDQICLHGIGHAIRNSLSQFKLWFFPTGIHGLMTYLMFNISTICAFLKALCMDEAWLAVTVKFTHRLSLGLWTGKIFSNPSNRMQPYFYGQASTAMTCAGLLNFGSPPVMIVSFILPVGDHHKIHKNKETQGMEELKSSVGKSNCKEVYLVEVLIVEEMALSLAAPSNAGNVYILKIVKMTDTDAKIEDEGRSQHDDLGEVCEYLFSRDVICKVSRCGLWRSTNFKRLLEVIEIEEIAKGVQRQDHTYRARTLVEEDDDDDDDYPARLLLAPIPDERKDAEQRLDQFQYTPQHLVRLLQIIVDNNCNMAVRQVASIHFKNFIAKNWAPHEPGELPKISASDKAMVRDHILVFLVRVPPLLRFKSDEERTPVYRIVEETFSHLLNLSTSLSRYRILLWK